MPFLRVDRPGGHDVCETSGTLDFDGGSLLVWRDHRRSHLVVAYGPGGWYSCRYVSEGEVGDGGEKRPLRIE